VSQISPHFSRAEFACKCGCGMDSVDTELLTRLEALHERLSFLASSKIRIHINSGNRCRAYNEKVGGEDQSQHMRSRAADITAEQLIEEHWSPIAHEVVADAAEVVEFGGIGRYHTFTHVDSRAGKARWHG
jgi:uncharacterized protein YcbK (DUF882 family)